MSDTLNIDGLHQCALTVSNLDRAIAFYEDQLGLPLIAKFDPPGLAFFDVAGVRLSLQRVDEVRESPNVLYFKVADIDVAWSALIAGSAEAVREPELVFPDDAGTFGPAGESEWMAFFRDPDGNLLAMAARK